MPLLNMIERELSGTRVMMDKLHVIAYADKNLDKVMSLAINKSHHIRQGLFKVKERLIRQEKIKLEVLLK